MSREKELRADNIVLAFGLAIVVTSLVLLGFTLAMLSDQDNAKGYQVHDMDVQNEIIEPFIYIDYEAESGFLNSEEVMASFCKFDQNGKELFMIQVERYGFSNPVYFEVRMFEEAVMFLEGIE